MVSITINKDDSDRIVVTFPYDPLQVQKVKTIEGYKWHPNEKHLGHKSSKTTEIYTHVSTKDLGRIKSPLDNLKKEVRKTKSNPVLSFVEGLVSTVVRNNRNNAFILS